jgi:hypothetical protein
MKSRDSEGGEEALGEGQEASEDGDGITGVSFASVTHSERRVSFDKNSKQTTQKTNSRPYCNFAYSALAAMRIGMSGSASFHSVRKS